MKKKLLGLSAIAVMLLINGCSTPDTTGDQKISDIEYFNEAKSLVEHETVISPYKGNQLANGKSPLDACFGKGKYAGKSWIEFKNDFNSDAIVCLVSLTTGRVIRNEYIRAGNDFKMSKLPTGTYFLKIYKGNDWNPTKINICGTKGEFDTDADFSTSDKPEDHIRITNSRNGYTTGSITLYGVSNGNMSTAPITEESFFNN